MKYKKLEYTNLLRAANIYSNSEELKGTAIGMAHQCFSYILYLITVLCLYP